ncbi:unnamed protein product [Clavelina lepadiformis]|uniref:Uncharacterized protein n=1 Tax=Clavelina lepadiformis TaxID=159417 RepID=A0ABP0EZ19_CLALP
MNKLLIYVVVFALLCAATISALPYFKNNDGRIPLKLTPILKASVALFAAPSVLVVAAPSVLVVSAISKRKTPTAIWADITGYKVIK